MGILLHITKLDTSTPTMSRPSESTYIGMDAKTYFLQISRPIKVVRMEQEKKYLFRRVSVCI
jgi:hypothetical protein